MSLEIRSRDPAQPACSQPAAAFGPGPWLVIAPHDDDAVLGCGLLIAAAHAAEIAVHVAVVTDGRMGWNRPEERAGLVERRRAETRSALAELGVAAERLHELGFADGGLVRERGCREEAAGSGLGRVLAGLLRRIAPGAVFACTPADLHPDHQVVGEETGMACCWAASPIWSELGAPIAAPRIWHYAVYCAFPEPPARQLRADAAALEAKLRALACFESQPFIDEMVQRLREDGPVEYFADATWRPYRPADYAAAFPEASTAVAAGAAAFAADCRLVLDGLAAWRPWEALRARLEHPLRLVGEGSSRRFPAGFARHLARRLGVVIALDACGGRAAESARDGRPVLWCSNSGATREVVEAARRAAGSEDLHLVGCADGPLAELVPAGRALLPRAEQAVAATASVWLQAFEIGAAIAARAGAPVPAETLAAAVARILAAPPAVDAVAQIAGARRLWWSDAECGLAEELALKSAELLGREAHAVPGTASLHGVEECFAGGDVVILVDPDPRDDALRERIATQTGVRWLALPIPVDDDIAAWAPLLQLASAWRLLAAAAEHTGRDPAHPTRARKVGNPLDQDA